MGERSQQASDDTESMDADASPPPADDSSAGGDRVLREKLGKLLQKLPSQARLIVKAFLQGLDPSVIHGWIGIALAHLGATTDPDKHELLEALQILHHMEPNAVRAMLLEVFQG